MKSTAGVAPQGQAPFAPKPAPSLYFISAPIDYAMVGVLSIITFILLRMFYTGTRTDTVITIAVQLSWICNWPHFAATSYRLYHSPDNIKQYPLTALIVPILVLFGIVGSFVDQTVVAPYFIKLVSIWSPYHFSGQTLGISLIYARRAGFMVDKVERFFLAAFIYSTFISQTVGFETGRQPFNDSGIEYPTMGLPQWTATATTYWMYATAAILVLLMIRRAVKDKKTMPPIILLPALTQFVWFVQGESWLSFAEFVPFFHSMQYMLIAWSLQLKEKMDREAIAPSKGYVLAESARWGVGNFILGACLFSGIPWTVAKVFGIPLPVSTVIVISGVQIHHFFIDGVIWKLKRKTVASPLMANLGQILGTAQRAPRGAVAAAA
ncbi:MAG: hypothetical protein HY059_09355 [Proteobacteria bacterium]|nr:hypothetical protein [Pseudomonadota bacterium]